MLKKIIFCFIVILCLSGCGEEHRFMTLYCNNNGPSTACKCVYNGISKHVKDMKHYNDWLTVFTKLNVETLNLLALSEARKLQASMGEELWEQYLGLLNRYTMMCAVFGVEDVDRAMEEIEALEEASEKKENKNVNNSSKNYYSSQPYRPKIPSKLVLDISKSVYEKNENISLLAQWTGTDVDCKILEEKVKKTLDNSHFEIVDNSFSCAGNDNNSLIQLHVQFKSPRIGKLNIPAITLDNNVSSNSVDFSVRNLDALQNAVASKNIESIKAFLSSSTDLDAIKIDKEHPVAHFLKDDMDFAQELIKLGASPDVIDKNGYTPLMYAVIRQDNEFLDLLLNKNANLNELDKKGRTAIMYAAIKNNIYATKKLVEHKANMYKSKDKGWSVYRYAKEFGYKEIEKLLGNFNFDELIIFTDKCDSCQLRKKMFEKIVEHYASLKIKYLSSSAIGQYISEGRYRNPVILIRNNNGIGRYLTGWNGEEESLQKLMEGE